MPENIRKQTRWRPRALPCRYLRVPIAFEEIASGAKGYYSVEENRIAVQKDMSEAQTIKTIIHEAAHQALHSREAGNEEAQNKSRNQKETEAESVTDAKNVQI